MDFLGAALGISICLTTINHGKYKRKLKGYHSVTFLLDFISYDIIISPLSISFCGFINWSDVKKNVANNVDRSSLSAQNDKIATVQKTTTTFRTARNRNTFRINYFGVFLDFF